MTSYEVFFRNHIQWGSREIVADTPAEALEAARAIAVEDPDGLLLDAYDASNVAINEIEICDADENQLLVWYDDDLRLQLAASDLLEAAEAVLTRWERGGLAEAVRDLAAAVAKAKPV